MRLDTRPRARMPEVHDALRSNRYPFSGVPQHGGGPAIVSDMQRTCENMDRTPRTPDFWGTMGDDHFPSCRDPAWLINPKADEARRRQMSLSELVTATREVLLSFAGTGVEREEGREVSCTKAPNLCVATDLLRRVNETHDGNFCKWKWSLIALINVCLLNRSLTVW